MAPNAYQKGGQCRFTLRYNLFFALYPINFTVGRSGHPKTHPLTDFTPYPIEYLAISTVYGFSMMEQVRLCVCAHGEVTWLFLEPDTGLDHCPRDPLSCFRARTSVDEAASGSFFAEREKREKSRRQKTEMKLER